MIRIKIHLTENQFSVNKLFRVVQMQSAMNDIETFPGTVSQGCGENFRFVLSPDTHEWI